MAQTMDPRREGIRLSEVARPLGVTLVAVLVWAEGLLYVAAGMIILVNLDDPNLVGRAGGMSLAIPVAITSFVVALAFLGLSGGLLRGNARARVVITILLFLSILIAAYVISGGTRVFGGILIASLALLGLILLWTPRASSYFGEHPVTEEARDRP